MAKKYTIKSINTSPTIADLRAIETAFNSKIDDEYAAMALKYPEYKLDDYKNMDDEILIGTITSRVNPTERHETSGEFLFWVENQVEGRFDKVARDYLNAIECLTIKVPVRDRQVFFCNTITYDHHRQVNGATYMARSLDDEINKDENGNDYVNKGLTTLLGEGKVHIHLYEDGRSMVVEADDDGSFQDEG